MGRGKLQFIRLTKLFTLWKICSADKGGSRVANLFESLSFSISLELRPPFRKSGRVTFNACAKSLNMKWAESVSGLEKGNR